MPPSLVLELQHEATNPNLRVADLLRKSLVVAAKLGIDDFGTWAQQELAGYSGNEQIPAYRRVRGELRAHNPYRGWIPVILRDNEIREKLESRDAGQAIGELEDLYHSTGESDTLQMPLPQDLLLQLFGQSKEFRLGMIPTLLLGKSTIRGLLDAVRNEVLRWSLELEQRGVLGEGMTFSAEEKTRAAATNYHIGTFSGVLGNVSSSQVQIGDYSAIHGQLKLAGVPQEARNELENILDALKSAPPEKRPGLAKRGMDWLVKYGPAVGTLSDTIRGWFDAVRGV
jgi:hypothetical protein